MPSFRPFKPLTLSNASVIRDSPEPDVQTELRPIKKRRLSNALDGVSFSTTNTPPPASSIGAGTTTLPLARNTLKVSHNDSKASSLECHYSVLWRKKTAKKHKTWDGDGMLSVYGGYAFLKDLSGRDMGKTAFTSPLLPGSMLSVGGKEVEIDAVMSREDYLLGRSYLGTSVKSRVGEEMSPNIATKQQSTTKDAKTTVPPKSFYAPVPKSTASKSHFKNPVLSTTAIQTSNGKDYQPRYDPDAPGALVMERLSPCPKGKTIVDVVVDPFLSRHLRPHQRDGVKFLYECVMGMRSFNGQGALLADEMGLGKTLQTIALIWTLLKQNPIGGAEPIIKKALIVCPVTLIVNWKKEFRKWLGNEKIGVLVADAPGTRITDFTHGRSYNVMIIGYEKLRTSADLLAKGSGVDIVIADEGHRLKTAQNKSMKAILSLNAERRILLSGTPIQNDLSEFFTMVDFINPGVLGKYNAFKREFDNPILKSRQPGASDRDIEKGTARNEELSSLTKQFILRRTAEILSQYLKPKSEYVLFCRPTEAQARVYRHVLESPVFGSLLRSSDTSLQLITLLKKVCNSPTLLKQPDTFDKVSNKSLSKLFETIPPALLTREDSVVSSKFRVLERLLKLLSTTTSEKIVLVSNYTSTLDILGSRLSAMSLSYLRLDGKTPSSKRQDLVDQFNRTPASQYFAFLLSAKSGGAGINLIGASRLVLFDVDWNPSTDLQAMARIHRDGQKRDVKIYRFLMAGGMDEKIYQRQITKLGLSDSVVDGKQNESSFSSDELRDLFRLDLDAECQTHDLLGCDCNGIVTEQANPALPSPSLEGRDLDMDSAEEKEEDQNDPERLAELSNRSIDSESDIITRPKLVPASQVNMAEQEARIVTESKTARELKAKGKMQSLMQYSHINADVFRGETKDVFGFEEDHVTVAKKRVGDKVLCQLLEEETSKVGYVFVKHG